MKKALGKGLGALISTETETDSGDLSGVIEIDINNIEPNKSQPRRYFDDESLKELADSLTDYGVIQPIIVKKEDGYYSIVAGERRWRAARLAGLERLPAIIKDYSESDALQVALIENLQRKDLNPIEEAICFKRLIDEYFYTQEDLAARLGKSRNSVSYALGLLTLDERVRDLVAGGRLTAGHARCLLPVKDLNAQYELADKIAESEVSVREAERMVKAFLAERPATHRPTPDTPPEIGALESDLRHIFGTKVNVKSGKNKGKIEIEYYSPEELERLLGLFKSIQ